jgi:hypothetical protein
MAEGDTLPRQQSPCLGISREEYQGRSLLSVVAGTDVWRVSSDFAPNNVDSATEVSPRVVGAVSNVHHSQEQL